MSFIMGKLPILIFILMIFIMGTLKFLQSIYFDIKNSKRLSAIIKISIIFVIVTVFYIVPRYITANHLPAILKGDAKNYIMTLDEVQSDSEGNKINLKKVLLDLNSVNFTYGVRGEDKVVAIEIKKNLADEKPLQKIQNVWIGNRFTYEYSGAGVSYNSDSFVVPLYLCFYLSNGEEVDFKVEDKKNVQKSTYILNLNREVTFGDKKLTIKSFSNALNYTNLLISTDTGLLNLQVILLQGDKEIPMTESWSSSSMHYDYYFYCDPINSKGAKLKLKEKSSGEEQIIDLR